jgi:hypothetical protein
MPIGSISMKTSELFLAVKPSITITPKWSQKVLGTNGAEKPVIFRLKRIAGQWKIYDAIVENISLVNNDRSQFDRVFSKSSFDALKKMLKEEAG